MAINKKLLMTDVQCDTHYLDHSSSYSDFPTFNRNVPNSKPNLHIYSHLPGKIANLKRESSSKKPASSKGSREKFPLFQKGRDFRRRVGVPTRAVRPQ